MIPAATDDVPWLDDEEKEAWSGLVSLLLLLPGRLTAALQRETGLTLFDYMVMSGISEAPGHCLRMSELAFVANGSLSRLSNVISRLEGQGWVERSPDPNDGRSTLAALTAAGIAKVVSAAPVHVRSVRREVLDHLGRTDQAALARVAQALRVRPEDAGAPVARRDAGSPPDVPTPVGKSQGNRDAGSGQEEV